MLKQQIQEDMKSAMKSGDKPRLGTIRLILAALKQKEVDERKELDDADVLAILDKMVKQRKDSAQQYQSAGREDLAGQELFEIGVCQHYLPAALEASELETLITTAIQESGATGMKEMGKVMALLRPKVQGRADMAVVSERLKQLLSAH